MGTIALTRLSDQICNLVSLHGDTAPQALPSLSPGTGIFAPGAIQDHQWRNQSKWKSFTRLGVSRPVKPATKKRGCNGRLASSQGTPFAQPFTIPPMSSWILGGLMAEVL